MGGSCTGKCCLSTEYLSLLIEFLRSYMAFSIQGKNLIIIFMFFFQRKWASVQLNSLVDSMYEIITSNFIMNDNVSHTFCS